MHDVSLFREYNLNHRYPQLITVVYESFSTIFCVMYSFSYLYSTIYNHLEGIRDPCCTMTPRMRKVRCVGCRFCYGFARLESQIPILRFKAMQVLATKPNLGLARYLIIGVNRYIQYTLPIYCFISAEISTIVIVSKN